MLWNPFMLHKYLKKSFSRRSLGRAGRNYKYPHRPLQGEREKARRRRQIERGMITAYRYNAWH